MKKYDSFRFKNNRIELPENKIRAWVAENFEFKERKNGEWLLICSPFTSDTEFKMGINPKTGIVNYWPGNEWAGPVNPKTGKRNRHFLNFVRIFLNCSYTQAASAVLGKDVRFYKTAPEQKEIDPYQIELPKTARPFDLTPHKITSSLMKWLQSRGYTTEEILANKLHYSMSMEVYWPYYEYEELVYWQSRSRINKTFRFPPTEMLDKEGNVIGKSPSSKGDFLYGFDDIESASYLILTEAIFDKNTIGEQALASGGAILTNNQINKIKLLGPKRGIILAPDNDKAGLRSILSNAAALSRIGYKIYFSTPPSLPYKTAEGKQAFTKDWNELYTKLKWSRKEIRSQLDSSIKPINSTQLVALRAKALDTPKDKWR
jgi:hypothetical protein